ncbi:MAG: carbohydrate-binding domain-containing protein [Candidatus Methanomethylophilaceae archaeon]|nr:carbohydrate-binding domain-containing protein [Candidatus Methanomethylophilaceae archaeon]
MSGKMNAMVVVATVLLLCMGMAVCLSYHGADDENSSAMPSGMGPMPEPDVAEGDLCEFVPMDEQSQTTPMDGGMMPSMDGQTMPPMPAFPTTEDGERPSMPSMDGQTMPAMPAMDRQSQMSAFPTTEDGERPSMPSMDNSQMPGAQTPGTVTSATSATEVVTSTAVNTAKDLVFDMDNATVIVMSDENNEVTISESGTYVVTGTCNDGNVVVKKGTTGVVLVFKDLDLTSTTGAPVSLNKNTEVKLVVEGTVKLTDAENPANEDSTDEEVADAFDGAALKVKDGANVYLTGTGTLILDASSCKNGVKVGDDESTSFVMEGSLTVYITAANDGLNSGYDLAMLGGTLVITAGDDAVHADHILTVGYADGTGPSITVKSSNEGLEGTVVNLFGGSATVNSTDDAVNAANSDGTFVGVLDYSVNVTGGTWTLVSGADGIDSNGNVNLLGGTVTIRSASTGGDAGIDYDGQLYVSSEATLNNYSGVSGADMMPGQNGGMFPGMFGRTGQGMATA